MRFVNVDEYLNRARFLHRGVTFSVTLDGLNKGFSRNINLKTGIRIICSRGVITATYQDVLPRSFSQNWNPDTQGNEERA
jgi:hypothetical protein